MTNRLLIVLLLVGSIFAKKSRFEEGIIDKQSELKRHNLSIGILDDKTGFSLMGYTYNIKQNEMNEYFIGGGTMIAAFTGTVGWKHYYRKSKLSISSILCGQYVAHMGFMGFLPTLSLTLEYNLTDWAQVKLGGWACTLLGGTSGESGGDSAILPFIGLNFRF